MFKDRYYQINAVNDTIKYMCNNPGKNPVIVLPTGSGKSVVVPRFINKVFELFNPPLKRAIVTVPSKELCQQNYEKIKSIMPGYKVGIVCSGLGLKDFDADIVVATIGSVRKYPDSLGCFSVWANDECHLAGTDGGGIYWSFYESLNSINKKNGVNYCSFGLTATPFKGNGVWITDGKQPVYNGISHNTPISDLLRDGFLSPLINPQALIQTRIDTSSIEKKGMDFDIHQLSEKTREYLLSAAHESIAIASDRKKWMAFLPDVSTAEDFCKILNSMGIISAVVHGGTNDKERDRVIELYKKGFIRCMITVVALTTGFDVPDIDCLLWLRSTHSYVLYMQGAGRGTRTAPGKSECLWVDFTDTTERLGAIDQIKGKPAKKTVKSDAPCIICPHCGEQWTPASKEVCIDWMKNTKGAYVLDSSGARIPIAGCGKIMRVPDPLDSRYASTAEIMASLNPYPEFPIDMITATEKKTKHGRPYICIELFCGMVKVASDNLFFGNIKLSTKSAEMWKELTGDYILQNNSFTACMSHLNSQLIFNKSLGISSVVLDRTVDAKRPTIFKFIR